MRLDGSGRVVDSGRATTEVLPEIIEVVGGRIAVLVDSGFGRGTDIIRALATGARAVCPITEALVPSVIRVSSARWRFFVGKSAPQEVGAPSVKRLTPALVQRA